MREDINLHGENIDDETFQKEIHRSYTKMSVSKRNLFQVPKGSIGKNFINEIKPALDLWNNNSTYRDVALKYLCFYQSFFSEAQSIKTRQLTINLLREKINTLED